MLLARRCKRGFDHQVRARGEAYFRSGRVRFDAPKGDRLEAVVRGDGGDYDVILDWQEASEGSLSVSCTCPYYRDEGSCKHVWATILAADARSIGPLYLDDVDEFFVDEMYQDDGEDEDSDEDDLSYDDDSDEELLRHVPKSLLPLLQGLELPASLSGKRGSRTSSGAADWRRQLTAAFAPSSSLSVPFRAGLGLTRTREVWYVLDVASTLRSDGVVIRLRHRETKLNGQFGKIKDLSVSTFELGRFTHAEDRNALRLLLANHDDGDSSYASYGYRYRSYGYQAKVSEVRLSAESCPQVLPQVCATGRLVWALDAYSSRDDQYGSPVVWDDGPPWRFRLALEPDDARKGWRLEGQLVREGTPEPVSVKTPVLLQASGQVLFQDRMARFDAGELSSWVKVLRSAQEIVVPYADRWELLERLWQSPARPEIAAPADFACEEVRLPPQGCLVVFAHEKYGPDRLYADVLFQYGDRRVKISDPSLGIIDQDHARVIVRDRQAEADRLQVLADHGARSVDPNYFDGRDLWISKRQLPALVAALIEAGWNVEGEAGKIRKPGQWRLSVTSGVDWFDLDGSCDFDGTVATLPELLEALRRGERFVRLGDGSQGLLPEAWLARFATLAGMGEAQDGHLRFRPSQALLLDALLAAQENVSVDAQFSHLRQKLKSFDGIDQRSEPRGFSGQLRDYQKDGLGWLNFLREFRLGGCLADDMGLGKTVQVLALLQSRRLRPKADDGRRAPSLAVVPRSLIFNWIEEAQRFTPNLRVLDYTGALRRGLLDEADQYDLVITTYGTLHRDIAKLKDVQFDYAILDEAQAIKNAQSQRAKACRLVKADHRLAMTGTPVENHLGELWSLFEFLNPGMLGRSTVFQDAMKHLDADDGNGGGGLTVLRRALTPFLLRRTKQQVLAELPEKTEQTLYCDLAGKQKKQYHDLREYYRASLAKTIEKNGMAKAKIHVLEALLRLRQAACHPGLVDKKLVKESSVKIDVLLEQLAEVIAEGHKALIFSQFTSLLAILRRRLDAENIVYEYLDGQTRNRKQPVDRFQTDPACPLFLISLKAGGHGLNLTAADYVFILDPWWNPAVEAQAIDRTHRIGQTRNVFAYRIIARDTVEEKILELQKSKRDLAEAIISADDNVLRNLTASDLQMLLS